MANLPGEVGYVSPRHAGPPCPSPRRTSRWPPVPALTPHRPRNGRSSRAATPVDTRARVPQLMRQSEESPRDLTPLFAPASVAVVGASNDPSKYGNWLSRHALGPGAVRRAHLVSRRGEPVHGVPTHRRLTDVGERVELVALAVPTEGFEAAVDDALAAGARAIVAITA